MKRESPVILLVEDNPDDEKLALHALHRYLPRAEVKIARDGQEALDVLSDPTKELPDLVLLDLKLPKVDGIDVLRAIRADPRTRHLVVIVLTSSDEPSDIGRAYENCANSYVRKPVPFDEFMDAMERVGLYWTRTNLGPK